MIGFWRGLLSTFSGLAFPLGNWWCGNLAHLKAEPRISKGLIVILPGVEGRSSLNFNIAKGLAASGLPHGIEIFDWTTGFWLLFLYHLRAFGRAKRKAKEIAARIQQYLVDFPDRPVFLIGHSGGGAEAVFVLESLPMQSAISGAILLGPAMSPAYDLTNALKKTKQGIWNFYSPFDLLILTLGTTLFGTLDGQHSVSAGAWGFSCPRDLSLEQRDLYKHQLHQVRYNARMIASWHTGGHFGWANRLFVAEGLAPIVALAAEKENIKRELERLTLQYREKAEDADKAFMKRSGELAVQIYHEVEDAVDLFAKSNAIELVLMYNDALKSQRDEFYSPPYVQQRLKMPNAFMPMYVDSRMDITDAITQMLNRRVAGGYSGGNSGN